MSRYARTKDGQLSMVVYERTLQDIGKVYGLLPERDTPCFTNNPTSVDIKISEVKEDEILYITDHLQLVSRLDDLFIKKVEYETELTPMEIADGWVKFNPANSIPPADTVLDIKEFNGSCIIGVRAGNIHWMDSIKHIKAIRVSKAADCKERCRIFDISKFQWLKKKEGFFLTWTGDTNEAGLFTRDDAREIVQSGWFSAVAGDVRVFSASFDPEVIPSTDVYLTLAKEIPLSEL